MIGAGFCLQWYRSVGSLEETVAKVRIAFIVSGIIFVIAVYFFEGIMIYGTNYAPDLGFSEIKRDVEFAFPVTFKISLCRSFLQISPLSRPGPEFLLRKRPIVFQHRF